MSTVTCTRCHGSGIVGFRGGVCFLCGGSGTRPVRSEVIAQNRAGRARIADRNALQERLWVVAIAAAETHTETDRPAGASAAISVAREVVADAVSVRLGETPLRASGPSYTARRRPVMFAAAVAAVAAELEGASHA